MNRNTKIILSTIVIVIIGLVLLFAFDGKTNKQKSDKLNIVATTFSTYDFSKQIVGEKGDVTFLLGPGVDAHSYEPSASDLIKIQNADVLIYIGGEMEKWMDKVLETDVIDINKTKLIKVTDSVNTIEEIEVDGAEEEEEEEEEKEEKEEGAFDEHIWTSPENAIKMVNYLSNKFSEIDNENKEFYQENANTYTSQIRDIQS